MADEELPEELQSALKMALTGIALVVAGIVWVFVRPVDGMFGPAEALAFIGFLVIFGAVWRAAFAGDSA